MCCQTEWTRQSVGSLASLHAVFFLDENQGWAGGTRGTLLSTVDAGNSWQLMSKPTTDIIRDLYFVDNLHGWLVCAVNSYDATNKQDAQTYLMQTDDGGASWNRLGIGSTGAKTRVVGAVLRRKGGRGWAFGEEGTIFATQDSGKTWQSLQSPTHHLLLGGTFIDDNYGWLVGTGATILRTSDGGYTWQLSGVTDSNEGAVRFAAVSFVDNRGGWVVGTEGRIYRTIDGGSTWQSQSSGTAADLFDVKFLDRFEGWAVGARGTIVHTVDGGLHWTIEPSGTQHPLEKIFLATRNRGWVVGFGGTILTYKRAERRRRAVNAEP